MVSPQKEECIELGKELVAWATEETEEWRCLFQQWYSIKKKILRKDWKAMVQVPEFLPYYEQAQSALARKAADGTMEKGFGQRYLRLYDKELIDEENNHAKFNSELKKSENDALGNYIVQTIDYAASKNNPPS